MNSSNMITSETSREEEANEGLRPIVEWLSSQNRFMQEGQGL